MPRNGSGTYTLPSGNPVVTGSTISSTVQNNTMNDLAAALTASLANDGQTSPTANLPMAGFRHTNVGSTASRTDYARADAVQDGAMTVLASVSGTDTITASSSPAITSYATNSRWWFTPAGANTGAATLNINGLGAKSITKSGTTALVANDLVATIPALVVYDGTQFQLINPQTLASVLVTGAVSAATVTTTGAISSGGTLSSPNATVGAGDGSGTPSSATVRGADAAGTNIAGVDLTIRPGVGTGNAAGGSLLLQTAPAGSSGTTAGTPTTRVAIDASGRVTTGGASVASGYTAAGDVSLPASGVVRAKNTAKAWGRVSSGGSLSEGFNVSITYVTTGTYTVTFTNAMANSSYAVVGSVFTDGISLKPYFFEPSGISTSGFTVRTTTLDGSNDRATADLPFSFTVLGTLA